MITKLTSLTKKSFANYSTPADFFKEKNLIFGYNGRGKSSLANGIITTFENEGGNNGKYRYFNSEYIRRNLMLEDGAEGDLIKGIKATFSEKDIKDQQTIKSLCNEIVDEKHLVDEIKELRLKTRELIDLKHEAKKGKLNINKKQGNKTVSEVVDLYKKDILEAKKIQSDEKKLCEYQGNNDFEEAISLMDKVTLPNLSIEPITDDVSNKLAEILQESYEDINIPTSDIIGWINDGIKYHKVGDRCQFCGSLIDYSEIQRKVLEYTQNKKQSAEIFLKQKLKKFVRLVVLY